MDLEKGMALMAQLAKDPGTTREEPQILQEFMEGASALQKHPDRIVNAREGDAPMLLSNELPVSPSAANYEESLREELKTRGRQLRAPQY